MRSSALLSLLPLAAATPFKRAPLLTRDNAEEGKYIIVMNQGAQTSSISSVVQSISAEADHVYNTIGGFAASLTEKEVETLRNDPNVAYIQQNGKASIFATQQNAPWGLARLSNRQPGSTTYTYNENAGDGVCVYVVDTGIDIKHPEFEGRATWVAAVNGDINEDDHGHGTHCAGTVGGKTFGVSKKSKLFAIKAFDASGDGSDASMIAGMEKVIEDAPTRDCPNGVVVSMSFGGDKSEAVNAAGKALVDAGFFGAVAAGNGDFLGRPLDAGTVSPASEESLCTVGATDKNDKTAYFTNYGKVVDIFGPGVDVLSAKPGNGSQTMSGTSMATPHIAGLGAYFLSQGTPAKGLCEHLQSISLKGVISAVHNSTVNYLAQNGEAA
ncbi:unnamed protein product [Clonostachys byssicola]|uniref:Cuticle-degrading protease n=1 Tax=Clonostachys byssicola TaxID=160290 RepID=A0A9N9Y0V7_9HYPO|nr:unnamed protein product [Clonostachys byssicola]